MSYNTTKVSTKEPNSNSEITLNLADVSSVLTPSQDQVLGYNGTAWINQTPNWVNAYDKSAHNTSITEGLTSNTTIILNYTFGTQPPYFYRFYNKQTASNPYGSFITSSDVSTLDDVTGATTWFAGFKFVTAGVYRITAKLVVGPNSTNNSFLDLQISNADNSITYSPRYRIGNVSVKQRNIIGIVNASANDEVGFYKHGIVNSPKYSKLGDPNILVIVEKVE
jgi:hypothetical protein